MYVDHADWRQSAGYLVLTLDSVVELALAAAITRTHPGPMPLVAALIVVTSGIVGWLFAMMVRVGADAAEDQ